MNIRLRTLRNRPIRERFDASYQPIPIAGCWLWESTLKNGYGLVKINRRGTYAHRLSWELANGRPVPSDMEVCHRCDVKCCVNPAHLFLGTHQDNMDDAWAKGIVKHPPTKRGIAHGMVKLTREQVMAIRKHFDAGIKQDALAFAFGITQANVSAIGRRKTWRHI